jgi:uncharacterized protein (DUF1330 family)
MPAYWIAHAHINDPVEYKKYTDKLPALFGKFGARVLARGGDYKILEGSAPYERHVVIEFESLARAEAFFNSPEYQEAAWFRRQPGVANNLQIIVDGVDATPK